jgi:hypothetical protein
MLLQSKNIFAQIAQGEIEISAVYFWVLLGVVVILFIYLLQKTNQILDKKNKVSEVPDEPIVAVQNSINATRPINGEEAAAIAMALSLYKKEFDRKLHLKTTIQRVSRAYSPWNSKIYTLRQNPRN